MENILRYRKEVNKELSVSLNHLIKNDKKLSFTKGLEQDLEKEALSNKVLAKGILVYVKTVSNINHFFEKDNSEVENLFSQFITHNDKSYLFQHKRELEYENERFLNNYQLSYYKNFNFDPGDHLLNNLNFINFFTTLCDKYRLKKFRFIVDEYQLTNDDISIVSNTPFDFVSAFPEAIKHFDCFFKNRVSLYYLNFLLKKTTARDQKEIEDKGNLELFKPGSEFSKTFNDQKVIPDLIYNHISKVSLEDDYINSFFSRLRIILRHSTYKNEVLMKKNKASTSIFKNIVSKFTGNEYKYTSEVYITKEFESDLEDFKKLINHKSLDIKLMKRQFPK